MTIFQRQLTFLVTLAEKPHFTLDIFLSLIKKHLMITHFDEILISIAALIGMEVPYYFFVKKVCLSFAFFRTLFRLFFNFF